MDYLYYSVLTFAWALGGFISGITSMGCSLVALPILCFVMDTSRAVLISCAVGGIVPMLLTCIHHRGIIQKEIIILLAASLPGSILGLCIYEYVSPSLLNIVLGSILGIVVFWQTVGRRWAVHIHDYTVPAAIAGFFGGLVNAVSAAPGASMGIYAALRPWSKESLLSMQSIFFAVSALFTICLQISRGLYSLSIATDILCCFPGMALGILLSIPAHKHLSEQRCRCFLFALLALSSIMLLGRGLF